MSTSTKKCIACGQTFPATIEYFGKSAKNKSGLNTRCLPCAAEKRRADRQRQAEALTDDEWRARREKLLAKRKEYRKKNRDKLIQQKRTYRRKVNIPKWLRELEQLKRLRHFRDNRDEITNASSDYDHQAMKALGWSERSTPSDSAAMRRELSDDSRYGVGARLQVDYDSAERKALYAGKTRNWLEASIDELKAKLSDCSLEEIKEAVAFEASREFVPQRDTEVLSPAEQRLFKRIIKAWEKREAALTEAEKAERWKQQWLAIWSELEALEAEGLMDDFWHAEARQAKKEHFADKDGRAAPTPDPVQPSWDALAQLKVPPIK